MKARMRFGPLKRSCSSINLTQLGCPEHSEPPLIIHTHRSCGSSPARSRPHHCHEIYDPAQCEIACKCSLSDASEQMTSHTTPSRPLKRSRSQIFYPTGYFNALDVATGIRNALHGCKQGGVCVSNNRHLQRMDLRPTPMLHNSSNFENNNIRTTCVEDVPVGLGLATVLCPKVSHDVGFQIQKRAPRGLAAVIDADCTCLEIGPQIVSSEHCHDPCPPPGLSLPSLQEFHQKVASSSPRNTQVITNIDMLDKFEMPPTCESGTESVGSSRTSVRIQTEVQRDPEHSCLGYNSDDTESSELSVRTWTRWGSPLRDGRRSRDMRPLPKRKRRSCITSSSFREDQPSSSYYREPVREFDPDEDALREQLQRMSFNELRKLLPLYSSWMPRPDSDQGDPKRLSISVPAPSSQRRGSESLSISVVSEPSGVNSEQDDIELEDNRWPSSNAGGSSKTSVVSFSQSTGKHNNRDSGSGSKYSVQVSSSSDTRSDNMANKEESLRSIVHEAVHQAVQGEPTMQKAMQKAVHQELSQRSSSFESDESQRRSPRPSTSTSDEQSAYAKIVANATKKTQETLDETQAALTSRAQSKSRPNSRISSINNLRSGSSSSSGRLSGQLPLQARLNFKDHKTSITELLNSMNSVTQLLNSLPLQGNNGRLSIATRKSTGPQRGSGRPPSRIQSSQWLSANRGSGGSFQQQQYDIGLASGSQRLPSNMGGGSFQQQQYDMGARSSQQPQFNVGSGGSFQQQPQYDMEGMSAEQSQRDMEAGVSEGSFSQGYPNPRSSGQGITQKWYGSEMPLGQGSQFAFDPNRPRSQSMPGRSQLVYGWNSSMQQSKRASRGSILNRRSPSNNLRLQSSSMMGQRGSQGSMSQQGQRRSRLSVSGYDPNESEMTAKSSLVLDQQEPTAYPEEIINTVINESEETVSNTIPNGDDSTYQSESPVGEFRQSQVGEFPQSLEGDGSLSPLPEGDVYQDVYEDMGGDQQQDAYGYGQDEQSQGMTVNCQPNINSEMLDQVPELLPYLVKRLKGSSNNPVVTPLPTPLAKTQQFDHNANHTMSRTLAKMLVGTDSAKPNVASSTKPEQFHLDARSLMTKRTTKRLGESERAKPNVALPPKPGQFHLDASIPMTRTSAKVLSETGAKPNGAPVTTTEECHRDATNHMTRTLAKMLIETDGAKPNVAPPAESEHFNLDASNPKAKSSEEMLTEIHRAKPNVAPPAKSEHFDLDATNPNARSSEEMLREIDRAKPNLAPPAKPEQFHLDASNPKAKTTEEMLRDIDRAKPNVAPTAKSEQFDLDASNPKSISLEEMLTETGTAKPNVAETPCEFQHHLLKIRSRTFQHIEFVKPETHGRKSLSNTVCAMIQELEVLESRNRQKSAAYKFIKTSTKQRVLPKGIAS